MKIRVIRDYSGEEGVGPDKDVFAGTEHVVARVRGNQLKANGLVEILEDSDEEETPMPEQKSQPAPQTTAAPAPTNKAAPKPRTKAAKA